MEVLTLIAFVFIVFCIIVLPIMFFLLLIFPEILIIPILFMEFILRLFGKSFDDDSSLSKIKKKLNKK